MLLGNRFHLDKSRVVSTQRGQMVSSSVNCVHAHVSCYVQTVDPDNSWIALLKVWIHALHEQSMDWVNLVRSVDYATIRIHVT